MLKGGVGLFQSVLARELGQLQEPGASMGFINWMIIVLCALTIALIAYVLLLRRGRRIVDDSTSKWLLLIALILLSPIVYLVYFGIAFEESKTVSFCNSCHVMNGYVKDLIDPDSETIAALHYQYRWIADNQCFQCHSEYGIFGNLAAKFSGIRHIWSYYIVGYETPIKLRGTYNNQVCLHCHGPVRSFQDVDEHKEYLKDLEANKQSCFGADCHVSPHPKEAWKVNE
ncbi:MAG: hypothetical protein KatS3mg078_0953 [Deltaproteobacteria bacterium]|jgi:cytochrome c nitrite reductase small subunit|nr:MAG: hypothetical protein KatS3mg078_0953 [Deltaproteobacteria bacterium]